MQVQGRRREKLAREGASVIRVKLLVVLALTVLSVIVSTPTKTTLALEPNEPTYPWANFSYQWGRPQVGEIISTQDSLPVLRKEEDFEVLAPSLSFFVGEEVGARLSVYVCVGGDYDFCPDGTRTASGLPVGEGVAACDPSYFKRSFRILGDPFNILWTCLDKGGLVYGNVFDLWFYYLGDGQAYKNLFPNPVVAFVD